MFGYIKPQNKNMTVNDFEVYRSFYCGLCKQLQISYGFFSRFLLNYDLVLLALVADCLSGESGLTKNEYCFVNPIHKKQILHSTSGLKLAADALVILSYHQLVDHITDESFWETTGYRLAKPFLRHIYLRAAKNHPSIAHCVELQMDRQRQLENAGCVQMDEACDPTAQMCAALFAETAVCEMQRATLTRMGLFAGQIIYLLDAGADFLQDTRKGHYNVFLRAGCSFEESMEMIRRRCFMAAAELVRCYRALDWKQGTGILDNIFYLGLSAGIKTVCKEKNETEQYHGQAAGV